MTRYRQRPAYQRHDDLGWIGRAKRAPTRQNRLEQMLQELERGDRCMKRSSHPALRGKPG
ncbi:MAG TPA: YdeI/OmpD-associated family protein [Anaerolineales bacterium]|nr:YdeI/OmpD-associated family protein [Anaerolineales bacterium]